MMRIALLLVAGLAAPATAQGLQQRVEAVLAEAGPGVRYGMVVTTEDGRELIAIRPTDRFIPASNTKLFPTAAAYASFADIDRPDTTGGASVRLEGRDVVLTGNGDARLSSAADCAVDCLATLADAVAARTRRVGDVIGDDSLFPDQRWSPGMSWNNIPTRSGTAISALTLDNNEIVARVTPGAVGATPGVALALPYYTVDNRAVTVATGRTDLEVERLPGERRVRLVGTIMAGVAADTVRMGIDDPAHYAAWRFKALLEARGVRVTGTLATRHRPFVAATDDPAKRGAVTPARPPRVAALAQLTPPPLSADVGQINKASQNLHSELMIRRLGLIDGVGSIEDGRAVIAGMLARAGVPRTGWEFADGSGMSSYNRLAPRAVTIFLRWVAAQPWGAAWRASLPVAGVDGTLGSRFRGGPLAGRLFAKTGTLNATNALSGYMTTRQGRTLIVSTFANDVPAGVDARVAMDRALELVANEN